MTVRDNLAFGLETRKVPKDRIAEQVDYAARTLAIEDFLDRKPAQLSGGQRQRVAIGRAIVRDPAAFLMDEPLSNLDAKLRVQMRGELALLQRRLSATVIFVTHDQVEAMTMGDRVAVMWRGVLQQVAPPSVLYEAPANLFVANFIGSPAMNFVEATVDRADGGLVARTGELSLPLTDGGTSPLEARVGEGVLLGFRPEHIDVPAEEDSPHHLTVDVDVDVVESLGYEQLVYFHFGAQPVESDPSGMLTDGSAEVLRSRAPYSARLDPHHKVEEGRRQFAIDTRRLHVFDRESGAVVADWRPADALVR